MSWTKCPNWRELSTEHRRYLRDTRRLKLYADENVDEDLIDDLRYNRVNILSARELGNQGKPDTFHCAFAHKKERCLLTKDRDFLNDRAFPFNRLSGLLVIKDHAGSDDSYWGILDNIVGHLVPYGDFINQMKVEVSDTMITWRYVDDRGFIAQKHFQLIDGSWHTLTE